MRVNIHRRLFSVMLVCKNAFVTFWNTLWNKDNNKINFITMLYFPYSALALHVLYKAEKLSVCLHPLVCLSALFGMLITQPWQHRLKWDLLEMKAVSLRITKFLKPGARLVSRN